MQPESKSFNPWPAGIIATFVIFISATVWLVVFTAGHRMDLVSPDYYEQEIRHQARLDGAGRALALPQRARVELNADGRSLRIVLPPDQARLQPQGRIELYRPSAAGKDRTEILRLDATGAQSLDTATLLPGLWKVRVHWTAAGEGYFMDESVIIPPRGA